ncbi:MAG: metallophosphoesterase [Chloroflexaceae bacterium]|nr:metallophosphoesterase [Chloroflexaceae bacterium]
MKKLRLVALLVLALMAVATATLATSAPAASARPIGGPNALLTDPFLQLPTRDSVRVVWFTEFAGSGHSLSYGEGLNRSAAATSSRMSRMFEDGSSRMRERSFTQVTERPVWRHEAIATGLTPGVRVPYVVSSVNDAGSTIRSEQFTMQPLPAANQGWKILLTSDQQNRLMSPANFQKVMETVGQVDAVFLAGDFVDTPHRASEWFDRYDATWLNTPTQMGRPAFPNTRPAFFPAFQGNYQDVFPEFPYRGGEILQNAPLFGSIGNHEAPGRWRPDAPVPVNGAVITANLDFMDGDPQPRWYAELRYEQQKATINPSNDPAIREQWIRNNSYEFTQYFEMWSHPDNGPQGESYYAYRMGDVFLISMNVSRVWRTWNVTENDRGKFTEFRSELNNPDNWGFGDMWFETYGVDSQQYTWLKQVLESPEARSAKYRVVMGHQTMFGLGDNAVPVMADPVALITYGDTEDAQQLTVKWPLSKADWEAKIQPILGSITEVRYKYPVEADVWKNDIEPLLRQHNVQLVHAGHSHVWNRAQIGNLNYIESSNVGNSFGAYFSDNQGVWKVRVPWANSFWQDLASGNPRWNPADYPRTGDAHGRPPIQPTLANPMRLMEGTSRDFPFVDSNNVTAFTIFDTATGKVTSYAFDTRNPGSEVLKFDEFTLASGPAQAPEGRIFLPVVSR